MRGLCPSALSRLKFVIKQIKEIMIHVFSIPFCKNVIYSSKDMPTVVYSNSNHRAHSATYLYKNKWGCWQINVPPQILTFYKDQNDVIKKKNLCAAILRLKHE